MQQPTRRPDAVFPRAAFAFLVAMLFAAIPLRAQVDITKAAEDEAHRRQSIAQQLGLALKYAEQTKKEGNLTNAAVQFEACLALVQQLGGVNVESQRRQAVSGLTAVRIQLAYREQERGEYAKAAEQADKLLGMDPKNAEAVKFKEFNEVVARAHEGRSPDKEALSKIPEMRARKLKVDSMIQNGRLYFQTRNFDEAEKVMQDAIKIDPFNDLAYYYLRLVQEARFDDEMRKRDNTYNQRVLEVAQAWSKTKIREVPNPNQYYRTNAEIPYMIHTSKGRQRIMAKLDTIVFPEVSYDGLPLNEVVKIISDDTKKYDPDKKGLNFIVNSVLEDAAPAGPAGGANAPPPWPPLET